MFSHELSASLSRDLEDDARKAGTGDGLAAGPTSGSVECSRGPIGTDAAAMTPAEARRQREAVEAESSEDEILPAPPQADPWRVGLAGSPAPHGGSEVRPGSITEGSARGGGGTCLL